MEKNGLIVIIFEIVCGLACSGIGIYYAVSGKTTHAAVFILVGVGCFVMAVRNYLLMRKAKKNKENNEKTNNDRN
ncbi:MAG: hypothetical protein K2O89_07175 [Clostridia bacterium]|nr:hypothetical protein [Clostridia bacterium]